MSMYMRRRAPLVSVASGCFWEDGALTDGMDGGIEGRGKEKNTSVPGFGHEKVTSTSGVFIHSSIGNEYITWSREEQKKAEGKTYLEDYNIRL